MLNNSSKPKQPQSDSPTIVTITGDVGGGKSVLCENLVQQLAADRYSTGRVQRRLADEMGITTLELNKRAETDPEIDKKIDSVFASLAKTPKNLVVDSRMAWNFLPESFKVKLEVHPLVSAQRIMGDKMRVGEKYKDVNEALTDLTNRKESERERFKRYYNADVEDTRNYDLVVNTTAIIPDTVQKLVIECISRSRAKKDFEQHWIAPKRLFPTSHDEFAENPAFVEKIRQHAPGPGEWENMVIPVHRCEDATYLILDQHLIVSACIKAGIETLPIQIQSVGKPDNELLEKARNSFKIWEEHHDFTFDPGFSE